MQYKWSYLGEWFDWDHNVTWEHGDKVYGLPLSFNWGMSGFSAIDAPYSTTQGCAHCWKERQWSLWLSLYPQMQHFLLDICYGLQIKRTVTLLVFLDVILQSILWISNPPLRIFPCPKPTGLWYWIHLSLNHFCKLYNYLTDYRVGIAFSFSVSHASSSQASTANIDNDCVDSQVGIVHECNHLYEVSEENKMLK